ncbi:hypothetical protein [Streptomyces sp. NPDC051364]|uniref:hypothetical protein n=1 Tax=Streptomyces sp. NPDC051364 TaxID=3155799 RepID=UPI0034374A31
MPHGRRCVGVRKRRDLEALEEPLVPFRRPHVTTLQRSVRTTDLDRAYDAVHRTLAATDTSTLSYRAVAIGHADGGVPGQGLAVILLRPGPQVLAFQAALPAAITPFTGSGGTPAAFVTDPGESISQSTLDWVDGYVPAQIGPGRYTAHITVGFATLDDLEAIEAEPLDAFTVRPAAVAAYQLGNSGAARKLLRTWPTPA